MRFLFNDKKLKALYTDKKGAQKYGRAVVESFFEVMAAIEAAPDTQDLRKLKGLRFEKLKGSRKGQHSMRLTDQWRLVFEIGTEGGREFLRILEIADYH